LTVCRHLVRPCSHVTLQLKIQPTYRTARQGHGPNRSAQETRRTPKAKDLPLLTWDLAVESVKLRGSHAPLRSWELRVERLAEKKIGFAVIDLLGYFDFDEYG